MAAFVRSVLLSVILAMSAERAEAAIKICNNFSQTVYFAMAYAQPGYDESYISRGWLVLNPNGGCDQFDSALHLTVFWYYAETNQYKVSKNVKNKNMWGSVRADKQFWIATNSFNFINNLNDNQSRPGDPGARLVGFTRSVESKDSELDETLTIEADGINVSQSFSNNTNVNDNTSK
ncbi:DUF1036 domain-containing protein [Mesorhizobium sp. VK25A]|uniref:DUF1036 domain-containing protein n=1 Tax=Mesorhizobium vachelliae TaxID=3072309 RepID=A0ABU4ZVK6_9HYPH|nr:MULTISPECIES: DUF1036 domain-containing protein [unclassified Mesorhizobium]MDX8529439.1 DUF1036 domain-containing protein [Mesorhizobium sp. VK25D]MDX8545649.1 DUF1036 domain-containing protein [Mesorhizobium sp. VK25A]